MKALFVLQDQMWAGYNVGWTKKTRTGLGPHSSTSYDPGQVTDTLPQPYCQLKNISKILMFF